ncbi:hypothetical protein HK099_003465 [Clydaea vesicula]|uniref:DNA 3'-5' helicase n=1 Tax=Clydaea vesicula TaxID=447962 RepID=A0AAD5Y099_9FUNG|nr:hypothetical protein HK099_003465 [Clydaea vesicula]
MVKYSKQTNKQNGYSTNANNNKDTTTLNLEDQRIKEHKLFLPKISLIKEDSDVKLNSSNKNIIRDDVTDFFSTDYTFLPLKPDHKRRPLWVCHDGRIILEAFNQLAEQAQDFLITISEPVSRPTRMHEYKLTPYSLYAAVAVGMETQTIIDVLERFSKVKLPDEVTEFVKECTMSYGKVKLVLKHNRYFLESNYPEILRRLLQDDIIKQAYILPRENEDMAGVLSMDLIGNKTTSTAVKNGVKKIDEEDSFGAVITLDRLDEEEEDEDPKIISRKIAKLKAEDNEETDESDFTSSFEIDQKHLGQIREHCSNIDFPLMEEYDFRNDTTNATLDIDLSPKCIIRDYQEKSLSKMFGGGGGRARSGIIVLSVQQWANEFKTWSSVKGGQIAKFTAENKAKFDGDSGIVISTYTMIAHSGKRSYETEQMLSFINATEWGLMILDEVHVVPANVFRRVLTTVAAHTKLGLTATLVREDDKIQDLNFLIGPKLFEANWMDLAGKGHIAKVEATEIWCPMTGEFYHQYLASSAPKRRLLCVMNPAKFMACQFLIDWREKEGDKIIVFSDNVFALQHYAMVLNKPFLYGATTHEERSKVLDLFRKGDPKFRTIFLSKVGDTSLDLPEATCLIQISSQFGSRRQEAQRMGRILRAKRRNEEGFRSRFYTLVSRDTDEVAFSAKRKRFLIDQGYEFKIISNITELIPPNVIPTLKYSKSEDQIKLLNALVKENDSVCNEEELICSFDDIAGALQQQHFQNKNKKKGGFAGLTPEERQKRELKKEREKNRNPLFKAWLK